MDAFIIMENKGEQLVFKEVTCGDETKDRKETEGQNDPMEKLMQ